MRQQVAGREGGLVSRLKNVRRRRPKPPADAVAGSGEVQVPKLASDGRRTVIAGLVSIVPGTLFDEFLDTIDFGFDPLMSDVAWLVSSMLVGWVFFGATYAFLTFLTFARADGETFARWLRETTPRTWFARVLNITSGGSSVIWTTNGSLIAVFAALTLTLLPQLRASPIVMVSALAAVSASWLLNAVSFAVHYARKDSTAKGLAFPGDDAPTFIDYFYLSVQVTTTYSSSDITTQTKAMRRAITGHSMLAFTFNTVIIAILVSLLVSAAS